MRELPCPKPYSSQSLWETAVAGQVLKRQAPLHFQTLLNELLLILRNLLATKPLFEVHIGRILSCRQMPTYSGIVSL